MKVLKVALTLLAVVVLAYLTLLIFSTAHAAEDIKYDLAVSGSYSIYQDTDLHNGGIGIKGEIEKKLWSNFYGYVWGSWERTNILLPQYNQEPGLPTATKADLFGAGIGGKYQPFAKLDVPPIVKPLKVFAEVGYYLPDVNGHSQNTLNVYWNHLYPGTGPLKGSYTLQPDVGGTIGLEYGIPIGKNFDATVSVGYKLLDLRATVKGYSATKALKTQDDESFSGPVFNIGLRW